MTTRGRSLSKMAHLRPFECVTPGNKGLKRLDISEGTCYVKD